MLNQPESVAALTPQLVQAVANAVSEFGAAVTPKLAAGAGEPEDQMRGPLETLLARVAVPLGVKVTAVGEASLSDLRVRPDYAVKVNGAITGYIEVKAPGKGADPTKWKATSHDGKQWVKLRALPNVLYTDGQEWGLYRTGERLGQVHHLHGDVQHSGAALSVDGDGLARTLSAFLHWSPVPPRSVSQLVNAVAPLTRLLRDEVVDTMGAEDAAGGGPFTDLATDWRVLLFPDADDFQFADGYAQSVTFALLLARTEGIDFSGKSVDQIAKALGKSHSLLGKALSVLTDETIGALTVTLDTLVRVISVVDFSKFAHHIADTYLHLYEHFLAVYDPKLRKETGSYYTPAKVVEAMTRMTDGALRTRLGRPLGLAADNVTVVDPAMGTGAYVLDVLESVATAYNDLEGPGSVPARLTQAAARIAGVEKQTGPYAVAELRIAEALHRHGAKAPRGGVRLYVADTLDDPFAEQAHLAATLEPIAASRRKANKLKSEERIVVVLGNPPYLENSGGRGGFIENGAPNTLTWTDPPLDAFREPGTGVYQKDLANLYIYFWRWATWKVFDTQPAGNDGVVCFITPSGYLKGPGMAGMRRYLRERASEGWVIDCTPEGHQPDVNTRIFQGVQQPIAIGLFVRRSDTDASTPATIHFRSVAGRRDEKFEQLLSVNLDGPEWENCPSRWTAPFLPSGGHVWSESPALCDLFPWQSPGLTTNRTWIFAPMSGELVRRWRRLVKAQPDEKKILFRESRDATLTKRKSGLSGFPHANVGVVAETGDPIAPVPVAYRSFDVQFIIPDDRLMHCPRPDLWRVRGDHQVYISERHDQPGQTGPGVTFSAFTPDIHYYNGRGGRVLPLYAASDKSQPNLAPGLLNALSAVLGLDVTAEDFLAYVAAVTAHSAFTARFEDDLRTPGIRVPISAEADVWTDAVELGRRVLWLHCRGARYGDGHSGRPLGPPRVAEQDRRPLVTVPIPDDPHDYPDELAFDEETQTLSVGGGSISPVSPEVVEYHVSGMNVLRKWFGYRRATRPKSSRAQSPLDDIRPESWPPAYTSDLLDVLHVLTLLTDLEPSQEDLLDRVLAGALVTTADLEDAGVLPVPESARNPLPKVTASKSGEQLGFSI